MLTVTPIGSCRIANPIRSAAGAKAVRVNTSRIYGYTHTSSEALQQARYLRGAFTPLDVARPLLMPKIDPGRHLNLLHHPSQLYVIEISSAKRAMVRDNHVQWNHVARHFAQFLADPARARRFWSLASGDREDEKHAFLASQAEYRRLGRSDQWLLRNITMQTCDAARLHSDISELLALLPRCLFVTHCNARMADGNRIPSRAAFISVLRWVLEDLGADYIDPTDEMEIFGQSRALKEENGSLSHYSPAFEAHLLSVWQARHFTPLGSGEGNPQPWYREPALAGAG